MIRPSPVLALAREAANRHAIELLAFSSAVFPGSSVVKDIVAQRLVEIGVAFAVNARRCFEVDGSRPIIDAQRFNYAPLPSVISEKDFRRALNGIVHARKLRVMFRESHLGVFSDHENTVPTEFEYETDQFPQTTRVDIFGLAWCHLKFGLFAWET